MHKFYWGSVRYDCFLTYFLTYLLTCLLTNLLTDLLTFDCFLPYLPPCCYHNLIRLYAHMCRFVADLNYLSAEFDSSNSRVLHVVVHAATPLHAGPAFRPLPLFTGRFIFDEPVRSIAARGVRALSPFSAMHHISSHLNSISSFLSFLCLILFST